MTLALSVEEGRTRHTSSTKVFDRRKFTFEMATAIFMNSATSLPSENATQSRLPLRRATYVHVSDLTSAYNIDHGRLEQELARAKAEMETQMHDNETPRTPSPDTESQLNPSSQKRLQPPRNGYNLCV